VSDDIHAERRIHQLEEQLRNARDDALEEAAKIALWYATPREIAKHILAQKGRPA
jgi:cell division protein FtsB